LPYRQYITIHPQKQKSVEIKVFKLINNVADNRFEEEFEAILEKYPPG
jgi:hypothetical protein